MAPGQRAYRVEGRQHHQTHIARSMARVQQLCRKQRWDFLVGGLCKPMHAPCPCTPASYQNLDQRRGSATPQHFASPQSSCHLWTPGMCAWWTAPSPSRTGQHQETAPSTLQRLAAACRSRAQQQAQVRAACRQDGDHRKELGTAFLSAVSLEMLIPKAPPLARSCNLAGTQRAARHAIHWVPQAANPNARPLGLVQRVPSVVCVECRG